MEQGENNMQRLRSIGALGVLAAASIALAFSTPVLGQTYFGKANVVDGDSLEIGGTQFRLFGIDAVEKHQTCDRNGQVWRCGADASDVLAAMIASGSVNCMQRDIDRYGRVAATCTTRGHDLAEQMVRQGYAVALRDFTSAYVGAEDAARPRNWHLVLGF